MIVLDTNVISEAMKPEANQAVRGWLNEQVRAGQHSIRINRQWRICFVWTTGGPNRVEIVDYH